MKKFTKSIFLFLFTISSFGLQAQDLDEILKNYYENIGGVEAWTSLESMRITGKSSMQGMEFPVSVTSAKPNKSKVEVNIMGKQLVEAFDGTHAWAIDPFSGGGGEGAPMAQKKNEEETKEAAKEEFEDRLINYKEKGNKVTLEGKEELEGSETYKVKLVTKGGDEYFYFFDTENFVPIMMRAFAGAGPMKGQAFDIFFSDYNEVEGSDIIIPYSTEIKMNGQTIRNMLIEKIELNVEIEEDFFSFPEKEAVKK